MTKAGNKSTPVWRRLTSATARSWWLAIGGGIAGALAFDPVALRVLVPLAPLGCYLAVAGASTPRGALGRGWLFGWIYYFGAIHWLCSLYIFNPLAPAGIVLLAGYLALYPGLIGYVLRRWLWVPSPILRFVLFAALWLLLEYFRTLGRLAAPLAQLGHAWATWPWAIQIASILGELGVSLLVLATAGWWLSLLWLLRSWKKRPATGRQISFDHLKHPLKATIISTLVFLILSTHCLGSYLAWRRRVDTTDSTQEADARLNVALVQPNVHQIWKLLSYASEDPAQREELSEKINLLMEKMLAAARPEWDLIILPETTFTPSDFAQNMPLRDRVARMVARADTDMLLGANRERPAPDPAVFNSAYFVHRDGTWDAYTYDKIRLVPFGECVPYFNIIPGLQENIVGIGSFNEGSTLTLFEARHKGNPAGKARQFGVLICFESTFSAMARAYVKKGADFLVVITNDAWYGLSAGAAQHHHLSLLRAVETRRWLLRCANTGISSIIDPSGRRRATLGLDQRGFVEATIRPLTTRPPTLFVRLGNTWLLLPLLLCFGTLIRNLRNRKQSTAHTTTTA